MLSGFDLARGLLMGRRVLNAVPRRGSSTLSRDTCRSTFRLIYFPHVLSLRVWLLVFNILDDELPHGQRDHLKRVIVI